MEKLSLYHFDLSDGYRARIESLIVCKPSDVESILGKNVYFGEQAGKHSEVEGEITTDMFHLVSNDELYVAQTLKAFEQPFEGDPVTLIGLSPFDYDDESEEE